MMTNTEAQNDINIPWYKVTWFWIIISPLIVVVVACTITITIAIKNSDDVVIGNYYKEGLLINDKKDRQRMAANIGLSGKIIFDVELGEVVVIFDSLNDTVKLPTELALFFSHPAIEKEDFSITLQQQMTTEKSERRYFSEVPKRLDNKWYWSISPVIADISDQFDAEENWLLKGHVDFEHSNFASF